MIPVFYEDWMDSFNSAPSIVMAPPLPNPSEPFIFLDRLATLTSLETLMIGNRPRHRSTLASGDSELLNQTLVFDSGLEKLRDLKQLQSIGLGYSRMRVCAAEIRWMVNNWPMLKEMSRPYLNTSEETTAELFEFLRSRGVKDWKI